MDMGLRFKEKVEEGGSSDHRPISFYWSSKMDSPPTPLKINPVWLAEEDFRKLVASSWIWLNHDSSEPFMVQFEANLKRTKAAIKKWIPGWKSKRKKELLEIEGKLSWILAEVDDGALNQVQLEELKILENKRNEWLKQEEVEWCLKSRALWLQAGDNNTKFFHHYASPQYFRIHFFW
jgi:hypothetical protein